MIVCKKKRILIEIKLYSRFFLDFDECCNGTDCPELSTCLNLPSSFECMCDEGHFVNGTICEGNLNTWLVKITHNSFIATILPIYKL